MPEFSELPVSMPYPTGERLAVIAMFMASGSSYKDAYDHADRLATKYQNHHIEEAAHRAEFWADLGKIREADIVANLVPKMARNALHAHPMLARGKAHELHAVGEMNGMGARMAICGLAGAFYEPPDGVAFPKCVKCFGQEGS